MLTRLSGLLLVGFALLVQPPPVGAQQPPGTSPGIWIADASGRLRPVQPRPGFVSSRAQGEGTARGRVRVVLAVESFAHSATGALAANQLATMRVIQAASSLGGATGASTPSPAWVEVEYERRSVLARPGDQPRLAGFRAITQVVLEARDPQRLGLVVDAAVGAGATRVVSVVPERRNGRE